MNRRLFAALAALLVACVLLAAPRANYTYTGTAGSPINLETGTTSAPASGSAPVYVKRIFVQMASNGNLTYGMGYVLAGVTRGRTPATSNAYDVTAQLAAATSTAPGGSYSDADNDAGIDIGTVWIDFAVTGNPVIVSYEFKK